MSCMVTITHNHGVSEMLANIRRGPFSEPSGAEKCEYLFTRVKSAQQRPNFEDYALEHVIWRGSKEEDAARSRMQKLYKQKANTK